MTSDILFIRRGHLRDFLERKKDNLKKEIGSYDSDYILNASEEDLCQHLLSKYLIEKPTLIEDKKYVYDSKDVDIGPAKGTLVMIAIPFDGDGELFQYQPSTFTLNPPRGEISNQELHLTFEMTEANAQKLQQIHQRELDEIKRYLGWVKTDVDVYNGSLEPFVRQSVSDRKEKLLADLGMVTALGIPVKRRDSLPVTYSIPSIGKKPRIETPKVANKPFKPEPILIEEEYEDILKLIHNMALVMERSPQTFRKLREEEIRNHFLMVLNASYEGQATGETFNYGGKTDILIRHDSRNVFIAECKFWRGERELIRAIDQLLGYASWRDTKTAVLLFSRNQDFSSVLGKIDPILKSHSCYKRKHDLKSAELRNETTFSYIFHKPEDKNREVFLTVMAFNVPM